MEFRFIIVKNFNRRWVVGEKIVLQGVEFI